MAIEDCFEKQTPKGPNYTVTDKFNYRKGLNGRWDGSQKYSQI
jgi:hypothetical protein